MIDFRAVIVTGAWTFPKKVRFVLSGGVAKCFSVDGHLATFMCTEPRRRPGHRGIWSASTKEGPIELETRCWTCGGHWRVARKNAEELYATQETS